MKSASATTTIEMKDFSNKACVETTVNDTEHQVYSETTVNDEEYQNIGCFQKFCNYGSAILLSFMFGFNHTSYQNIINISLVFYSKNFFPEHHYWMKNLPPTFFFIGGLISTIALFNMKSYKFEKVLKHSASILIISYAINTIHPHIIVIYIVRLLTGISSGAIAIIVPQILHKLAGQKGKGITSALFPCFLLVGLTSAVALIPLCTPQYYVYVNLIPIVISCLALLMLTNTYKLSAHKKDDSGVTLRNFFSNPASIKSAIFIVFVHLIQKSTGVDLIGIFSSQMFTGVNSYILGLAPLFFAILITIFSGFIPDICGRKVPVCLGLPAIASICLFMYFYGPNIILVLVFIFFFNAGLNVVPFMYQNEIVPLSHKAIANELGCISSWLVSILILLLIAFLYSPENNNIWLVFFALCVTFSIIAFIMMKETKGTIDYTFIEKWINIDLFSKKDKDDYVPCKT